MKVQKSRKSRQEIIEEERQLAAQIITDAATASNISLFEQAYIHAGRWFENNVAAKEKNNKCAIYETELFDALSMRGISLQGLMADDNDYKTLLKDKSANADERGRWSDMYGLKLLCKGVNRKLDVVYEELFS